MDVPPDSGYNRYADTGSSSNTILRYSYPIFLRSTTGRRNIRHTDALQLHVASFYRDFTLRFGHLARSYIGNDVDRHLYSVTDGTYLLFRLHERRSRFSTLLRFPIPVYHVYAGIGRCNQHLPDVPFLGAGGGKFLPANWFLLYKTGCHRCFQESVYCYSLC